MIKNPAWNRRLWTIALLTASLAGCGERWNCLCKAWDAQTCDQCSSGRTTVSWRAAGPAAEQSEDHVSEEIATAPLGSQGSQQVVPSDRQPRLMSVPTELAVAEGDAVVTVDSPPKSRELSPPGGKGERPAPGDYRVAPGDHLELLFHESWPSEAAYRLLAGDEIRVEFISPPNGLDGIAGLDRSVRIQPDGKISLPFLGFVEAAGLTPGELANELTGRYSDLYVDPQVLVTLVSTGRGLRDLRESMKAAGGRTAVVAADGTIRLPHIGMAKVADLTLWEVEDELNERYRRAVPGFRLTVRIADGN